MLHAVEHGKNHRGLAHVRRKVLDGVVKLVGFHREQHHIELTRRLTRGNQPDRNYGLLALTRYRELTRQLRGATGADQKGHLPSRRGEPPTKVAADTPCPDDQRFHDQFPLNFGDPLIAKMPKPGSRQIVLEVRVPGLTFVEHDPQGCINKRAANCGRGTAGAWVHRGGRPQPR